MLARRGAPEMARLPVADDGQLEQELNQRHRAQHERGTLLGGERLRQVERRRIARYVVVSDGNVDVVVVKVGVVAANLRREVLEEDRRQVEGLRAEGNGQDAEALLGLGQVDPAAAVGSGFARSA